MTDALTTIVWRAACDDVEIQTPFASEIEAWKALELTPERRRLAGRRHAAGAYVYPVRVDVNGREIR
jgi:hypothetical protein